MKKTISWHDTLLRYLKNSNEDESINGFFNVEGIKYLQNNLNNITINWLEVGIGPGTKTYGFNKTLSRYFQLETLQILEPSSKWRNHLISNNLMRKFDDFSTCTIIPNRFEDYIENVHLAELNKINFISLIHVLYSTSISQALLRFIDLRLIGNPCVLFVNVESERSDFFKIRKSLSDNGIDLPESKARSFLNELDKRALNYKKHLVNNKTCKIDIEEIMSSETYWLFPFLLGCSLRDFDCMEKGKKEIVFDITRKYLASLTYPTLHIPDEAILIHVGNN